MEALKDENIPSSFHLFIFSCFHFSFPTGHERGRTCRAGTLHQESGIYASPF
jgi:hypothetical protein